MSPDEDASAPLKERRFNEAEVAAIFAQASEAQAQSPGLQLPSGEGLTLTELQEIGREVGIPSEQVSHAAQVIARGGAPTFRKFLGFPIGVRQTIDLDRKLSDADWERLVVDLRETFDARGTVRKDGSLRQWTNGNLQALLEPTETGDRLRLRTTKGDARGMMLSGVAMFGTSAAGLLAGAMQGSFGAGALMYMELFATMGVVMFAAGAFRLPAWARLRRRQMSEVAARAAAATKPLPSVQRPTARLPDIP